MVEARVRFGIEVVQGVVEATWTAFLNGIASLGMAYVSVLAPTSA